MEYEEVINGLNNLKKDLIESVLASYEERGLDFGNERYASWCKKVSRFLDDNLAYENERFGYKKSFIIFAGRFESSGQSFWKQGGERVLSYIDSLVLDLEDGSYESPPKPKDTEDSSHKFDVISKIRNTCDKFHRVVKQLRSRWSQRKTLDVNDEYDVQDLLHALFQLDFEDIRAEEWVPSNAAKSTRVDFLLKKEKVVIEVKKTRKGLSGKEVSSQLIEDIHRYQSHPDCETLICFVYDPEERISNPRGIERDLNKEENGFKVEVWIRP